MLGSRTSSAVVLLCAGLALSTAGVASAQTTNNSGNNNQPLLIIPLGSDQGQGGTQATGQPSSASGSGSASGVEVQSLQAVTPEAAGTLDAAHGGFKVDMWQHSDPRLVAAVLPRIPAGTGSVVMTDLARRLLLTSAQPPAGKTGDLLAMRMERLVALGFAAEVPALAATAGHQALTVLARRSLVEAHFLTGQTDRACREVNDAVALGNDTELQKALVFCQRLAGKQAEADLGISVLQASNVTLEPSYLALNQAIASGKKGSLANLADATPLIFAMAVSNGATIDAKAIDTAPPAIARAIAEASTLPLDLRLSAGERAVALGAMPGSALATLYGKASFNADQITNALSQADSLPGSQARALLYQAAMAQTLPAARAKALAALLKNAQADTGKPAYLAAARAVAPDIADLPPSTDLAWFSADAAAALLAAGQPEAAARWWPVLQDQAQADPNVAKRAATLWPMFRLAFGQQLPSGGAGMAGWWKSVQNEAPPQRDLLAATYLASFAALGDPVGQAVVTDVVTDGSLLDLPSPPASLLIALNAAAHGHRLGETVALALAALGKAGPAGAHPLTLEAVVSALRQVGLGRDGRLLALEAAAQRTPATS